MGDAEYGGWRCNQAEVRHDLEPAAVSTCVVHAHMIELGVNTEHRTIDLLYSERWLT